LTKEYDVRTSLWHNPFDVLIIESEIDCVLFNQSEVVAVAILALVCKKIN
jgi:hypothetical protein